MVRFYSDKPGNSVFENESENVKKQDCGNAAAKRLLKRIKKQYPRLGICVPGGGLYGVEPLMKQCRESGWKYLFHLKEGTQKNRTRDCKDLEAGLRHITENLCAEKGAGAYYNGVEEITEKYEFFNVFQCSHEEKAGEGKTQKVCFPGIINKYIYIERQRSTKYS